MTALLWALLLLNLVLFLGGVATVGVIVVIAYLLWRGVRG